MQHEERVLEIYHFLPRKNQFYQINYNCRIVKMVVNLVANSLNHNGLCYFSEATFYTCVCVCVCFNNLVNLRVCKMSSLFDLRAGCFNFNVIFHSAWVKEHTESYGKRLISEHRKQSPLRRFSMHFVMKQMLSEHSEK